MSIAISEIPGISEMLADAARAETVTREDAWLASTYIVAGQRIRTMTVDDFTALLQFNSPLLSRRLPSPDELIFFLWVLSPENIRYRESKWLARFTHWRAKRFSKQMARMLDLKTVEAAQHEAESKGETYTLPDDSPLAIAIASAFRYVDLVFMDKPPSLKSNGIDSGLCYLTSWFCTMQREFHLPTKEVEQMPLPVLFARLKEVMGSKVPKFNAGVDKILGDITAGLNAKLYTADDLRAGRVDLKTCRLKPLN